MRATCVRVCDKGDKRGESGKMCRKQDTPDVSIAVQESSAAQEQATFVVWSHLGDGYACTGQRFLQWHAKDTSSGGAPRTTARWSPVAPVLEPVVSLFKLMTDRQIVSDRTASTSAVGSGASLALSSRSRCSPCPSLDHFDSLNPCSKEESLSEA